MSSGRHTVVCVSLLMCIGALVSLLFTAWCTVLAQAPSGWWPLDEGNGEMTADATGHGCDGVLQNEPGWEPSLSGMGLRFISNQWVEVTDDCGFSSTGPMSVAVWLNPAALGSSGARPFMMKRDGSSSGWTLTYNSVGRVVFRSVSGNVLASSTRLPTNVWSHVVATFDGSGASLFINGDLETSAEWPGAIMTSSNSLFFGSAAVNGYVGAMDDVRLFDEAITIEDVRDLYWTLPLRGWWALDEASGDVASDSSGYGNHGSLVHSPVWVAGVVGHGLYVGTNDWVVIPHVPELVTTNSLSIAAWINPSEEEPVAWRQFFGKGNFNADGWALLYGGNQKVLFQMSGASNRVISATHVPAGQWTHVAVTFDGQRARLFLNGIQDGVATWTSPILSNTNQVWLGGGEMISGFAGTMDEALISSVPLTDGAVYALYAVDTDGDGMPNGWELNQGLDPSNSTDANLDPDFDGLSNGEEFLHNTNPHDADTDKDGMSDGWEVQNFLNPRRDDSQRDRDHDRLTNLQEYQEGTDPWSFDTDADGYGDGQEHYFGTDPADPAARPASIPGDLLGWWKLDEGTGAVTADASGQDNTGTLFGAPMWTEGSFGNALLFSNPSQCVSVPRWESLSPASNMTASVWLRPASNHVGDFTTVFGVSDGWESGWAVGLTNDTRIVFRMTSVNGNELASAINLSTDQWTHVAVTVASNTATIYLNGILDTNTVWAGQSVPAFKRLNIGNCTDTIFHGVVDEARLYGRALTPAQLADLYDTDIDGDGMPNDWETQYGLDPFNEGDALGDIDGDGVNNMTEFLQGRDPTRGTVDDTNALVRLTVFTPLE